MRARVGWWLIPLVVAAVAGASLLAVRGRGTSLVAVVNSEAITDAAFNARMTEAQGRLAGLSNSSPARRQVLLEMIRFAVIRQEAERMGIRAPTDAAALASAKRRMGESRMQQAMSRLGWNQADLVGRWQDKALLAEVIDRIGGTDAPTEAELAAYFARYKGKFSRPEQVSIRAALFATEADARAAAARVRAGTPFEEVARQSTDQHARDSGGAMGWTDTATLPLEARRAIAHAKPGQVLGPFQGDHGMLLILFEARRAALSPTLAKVRDEVLPWAERAIKAERVAAWLNERLDASSIVIKASLGAWSPTERMILPPPARRS